jgi:TAT (twin-arginine translocation) pathway signal sequence
MVQPQTPVQRRWRMMSDRFSLPRVDDVISRRSLLRGGAAAVALATLPSCDGTASPVSAGPASTVALNVRVSRDRYREHVGPSLAVNSLHPRQLLVACQGSPFTPEFILTYYSVDGGASWHIGGMPAQPAAGPAGDDVTVAFGGGGRGYVCAARSGHGSDPTPANPDANRAVYVWRTDDGGRSFSAPVTLVEGVYSDHPWVAAGQGQTRSAHNVYVAWGAGAPHTALDFTRSTNGGQSFEMPRRILGEARTPSLVSAGPQLAAGPDGLVCAVCDWTTRQDASGDMIGQVVAVCSIDAGHSFAAPVHLGAEAAAIARPGGVRPNSGPTVAISSQGDAIYVAFPTHKPGSAHSDIVVTTSRDRGRTWSEPVTATPDDGAIYFQPNVAVDAAGRVAISAFALSNGVMDEVLLVSRAGELRFGPPLRVTTAPFNPLDPTTASSGKYGIWWIGDWQGIAGGVGAFHLVWNDTRTGKLDLFAATVRP